MPKLNQPYDFDVLAYPHAKMLEDHFAQLGDALLDQHDYPETREQWEAMRPVIREKLIASLGGFPDEPSDLNPQITGRLEREGCLIEKVRLESRARWYIGGNLYLPAKAEGPCPAVLCPHGHWMDGKGSVHVQRRCLNFARRGYVALSLDMPGYGDRGYQGHGETFYLTAVGMTLAGLQCYDNMRAIDYLCSRPEVDGERIGCTGASGGGNQTTYVSALDERIKASAPVCSVEIYQDYLRKGHCTCETIPEVLTYADQPHILGLMAGRGALLLVNAILDAGFPILRAHQALERLQRIFALYDAEALAIHEVYDGHAYTQQFRQGVYRWFDRWLKGEDPGQVHEPYTWVEAVDSDALLVGGRKGLQDEGAQTSATLYGSEAEAVRAKSLVHRPASAEDLRAEIVEGVFGGFPGPWPEADGRSDLRAELLDAVEVGDCVVEKIAFRSEPQIIVPALAMYRPDTPTPRRAVIFATSAGKVEMMHRRDLHDLCTAGCLVLGVDYRGCGETDGGGNENQWALLRGINLGRPLLGWRTWDVIRTVDYLLTRDDVRPDAIALWGEREGALLALYAAALDERIAATLCLGPLASYLGDQGFTQPYWWFPRNILQVADICDLARIVSPRALFLANPCDGAGNELSSEALGELFGELAGLTLFIGPNEDFERQARHLILGAC